MGLPRPINWLREAAINEEHLSEVQKAAQAVKQALDDAKESLSQMEIDNADQVQNLNQSLSEAMSNIVGQSGGARMFIVYQWWGFADEVADRIETDNDIEDGEAVAERIRAERYLAIPFRTAEMAASYLNSKTELLQSIAESVFYLSPEQEEDTPDGVLSRISLRDNNGNVIGYSEIKYWQYNADQPIPEEAGGGTGDWV